MVDRKKKPSDYLDEDMIEKLDRAFHGNSEGRQVAEFMLDGEPHSRQEIADAVGTQPNQIPRVVNLLARNRIATFKAWFAEDGRSKMFQRDQLDGDIDPVESEGIVSSFWMHGKCIEIETKSGGGYSLTFNDDGTVTVRTAKSEITIR